VKNTCNASVESKGFCFYKATNGIKRHLGVDSLGFPAWCIFMVGKPDRKCIRFFSHCTKASVVDGRENSSVTSSASKKASEPFSATLTLLLRAE
jgi:hypothetical protein